MDGTRLLELAVELPDAITEQNRASITVALMHRRVVEKEPTTRGTFQLDEINDFLTQLSAQLASAFDEGLFDAAIAGVATPGLSNGDAGFEIANEIWPRLGEFHGDVEHVRLFRIVRCCCQLMISRARAYQAPR